MEVDGWEMMFYVYVCSILDEGIVVFFDLFCYFIGYVVLYNIIGFMFEMYMLKFFKDWVKSIYMFMDNLL